MFIVSKIEKDCMEQPHSVCVFSSLSKVFDLVKKTSDVFTTSGVFDATHISECDGSFACDVVTDIITETLILTNEFISIIVVATDIGYLDNFIKMLEAEGLIVENEG